MIYKKVFLFIVLTVTLFGQPQFYELIPGSNIVGITSYENEIWIATYGHGIYKADMNNLNSDEWTVYSTKNNNIDNDLFYCIAVSKDFVWAGTNDGLYTLDKRTNQWRKRKFAAGGEFGNWIRSLCYDESTNTLYIGRFINLTTLDVSRQRFEDYNLQVGSDLRTNNFKKIKLEGDDYIWFATEGGAFRYNKKQPLSNKSSLQFFNNKGGNFRNDGEFVSITDFLFEKNAIWFATDEFITRENPRFNLGGLYRFNRRATWDRIDNRSGLPGNGIYTMERTGNIVWVSTYHFDMKEKKEYGRGLSLVNRINGVVYQINPDEIRLASNKITALFFDGNHLWIGADNGLWVLKISNDLAKFTRE